MPDRWDRTICIVFCMSISQSRPEAQHYITSDGICSREKMQRGLTAHHRPRDSHPCVTLAPLCQCRIYAKPLSFSAASMEARWEGQRDGSQVIRGILRQSHQFQGSVRLESKLMPSQVKTDPQTLFPDRHCSKQGLDYRSLKTLLSLHSCIRCCFRYATLSST